MSDLVPFNCPTHRWIMDTFASAQVWCGKCLRARPYKPEPKLEIRQPVAVVVGAEERASADGYLSAKARRARNLRRNARLRKAARSPGVMQSPTWHDGLIEGIADASGVITPAATSGR